MDRLLFNFHDIVLLMTTYQCTLFGLLLLVLRRENRLSNTLLAGFLFTQAAIPMDLLVNYGAGFRDWAIEASPDLLYAFRLAYWLEGPLLLWYTRSLIYKDFHLRRSDALFLLPALLIGAYHYGIWYRLDEADKLAVLAGHSVLGESALTHGLGFLREGLRVAFGLACVVEIRRCQRQIRQDYSNIESLDFSWLDLLVIGFLILRCWAVLVSVGIILAAQFDLQVINFADLGLTANYATFLLITTMIFLSLSYTPMFEGIHPARDDHTEAGADPRAEFEESQVQQLETYMGQEKPYLATILTLDQLAQQVGLPKRTLSNVINRHFGQNFFEYINHYRIDYAKQRLADPDCADQTILEILSDAGFNSKATFNTFFKKLEGVTPSQYRKQHQTPARTA